MKKEYGVIGLLLLLSVPIGIATYERNKVWSSKIKFWENILKNAPKKARAYNNYGVHLCEQQRYKEAIPQFKKAIKMDPYYPDPHNNVAICYSKQSQLQLGINHLKESLKIQPSVPEPYNNLASFLIDKNELEAAFEMVQMAIKIRPHYGKAYYNLGKIYHKKNDLENAWKNFGKGCKQGDLDNELGFSTFGAISMKVGKYDDAIWAHQKVLEFNNKNEESLLGVGNAYFYKKDYDKAIDWFKRILQAYPEHKKFSTNLAETYYQAERYQEALDLYEKILVYDPKFPFHLRKAECLAKVGKKDDAIASLKRLRRLRLNRGLMAKIDRALSEIQ